MGEVEPMDLDSIENYFDNKENTFQHNTTRTRVSTIERNDELDASGFNMKLRYSVTPASSPMSKSFTANCADNKNNDDYINNVNISQNLTRSLNTTLTQSDSIPRSPKSLPLQSLSTEHIIDFNRNSSLRRSLDTLPNNNTTIKITTSDISEENHSLPSISSSLSQTPEATTPTKEPPKQGSTSPIMRGLKSVFNMFKSTQSPITASEITEQKDIPDDFQIMGPTQNLLASTPMNKTKYLKQNSPLKESVVFKDDLERELQWKEDSEIFFKEVTIPIQKLFPMTTPSSPEYSNNCAENNLNATVEYMDVSYNEPSKHKTFTGEVQNIITDGNYVESDSEFQDCETTFTKSECIDVSCSKVKDYVEENIDIVENPSISPGGNESVAHVDNPITAPINDLTIVHVDHLLPPRVNHLNTRVDDLSIARVDDLSVCQVDDQTTALVDDSSSAPVEGPMVPRVELPANVYVDDFVSQGDNQSTVRVDDPSLVPIDSPSIAPVDDSSSLPVDGPFVANVELPANVYVDDLSIPRVADITTGRVVDPIFDSINDQSITNIDGQTDVTSIPCADDSSIVQIDDPSVAMVDNSIRAPINDNAIAYVDNMSVDGQSTDRVDSQSIAHIHNMSIPCVDDLSNSCVDRLGVDHVDDLYVAPINCPPVDGPFVTPVEVPTNVSGYDEIQIPKINAAIGLVKYMVGNQIEVQSKEAYISTDKNAVTNVVKEGDIEFKLNNKPQQVSILNNIAAHQQDQCSNVITHESYAEFQDISMEENTQINTLSEERTCEQDNICVNTQKHNHSGSTNGDDETVDIKKYTENNDLTFYNDRCDDDTQNTFIATCEDGLNESRTIIDHQANIEKISTSINLANTFKQVNEESNTLKDQPLKEDLDALVMSCEQQQNLTYIGGNQYDFKLHLNNEISKEKNTIEETPDINGSNASNSQFEQIDEQYNKNAAAYAYNTVANTERKHESMSCISKNNEKNIMEPKVECGTNHELSLNNTASESNNLIPLKESEKLLGYYNTIDKATLNTPMEDNNISTPPNSPKILSKGYNFNFDEIDNPFATKTKIRLSPSPPIPEDDNFSNMNETILIKPTVTKKSQARRSAPVVKFKNKPKTCLNSSYDSLTNAKKNKNYIDQPCNSTNVELSECSNITITTEKSHNYTDEIKLSQQSFDEQMNNDVNCSSDDILENKLIQDCVTKNSADNNLNECDNGDTCNPSNSINTTSSNSNLYDNIDQKCVDEDRDMDNVKKENCHYKNTFNIPEFKNSNQFHSCETKSNICVTPSFDTKDFVPIQVETFDMCKNENDVNGNTTVDIQCEIRNNDNSSENAVLLNETHSTQTDDKNDTIMEVHTEDEDTIEGPFLDEFETKNIAKTVNYISQTDNMMNFEDISNRFTDIPADDNGDKGEIFIDAEAFEFLLNQNKSNIVADSGKESLFLKFDPLFAQRVSSDGIFAALSKVQKNQKSPKKQLVLENKVATEVVPIPSCSARVEPFESNNEDTNVHNTCKPTMIVNPAVNPVVSRRSTTPTKVNRQSLTFTSPAMAVIDKLLSLSGNGNTSLMDQDNSIQEISSEQFQTNITLTHLREMLADKEIDVHNLRSESKDLKDRLALLETQVKSLEYESKDRLRKITDLNERLLEKTKMNQTMATVVEEYERTISSLVSELEQDKRRNAEERTKLMRERDEQNVHLSSMEVSFNDLHSKYEKSKQIILSLKANEDTYKKSIKEFEDNLVKMENNYELLKQHATSKLNHANQELEKMNRSHEAEILKCNAMIKRKDLHITSLEESLNQKTKANEELTAICDELINKVG